MSKFKLEFTLKQHTPMIHFQSEQIGATLRATELKPKLDRFLIKYFDDDFKKYKEYLIGYKHVKKEKKREPVESDFDGKVAFDYKVRIEQDLSAEDKNKKALYFGNMGDGKDKYAKCHQNDFKIQIMVFNDELKNTIDMYFEAFLANTNFGTRQTKGYGSFYIADKEFDISLVKTKKVYSFSSTKDLWEEDLKDFYSFLRAGINFPCHRYSKERDCPDGIKDDNGNFKTQVYIKPAIFHYAKSLGITWDKKVIKEYYLRGRLRREQEKYDDSPVNYGSNNKKLLRDLFGLSSEQDWSRIPVKKSNPDLERFKSPITFKPILDKDNNAKVYFWTEQEGLNHILNKEFSISYDGREGLILSSPKKFSFDNFFTYTFEKNIKDFCEDKYKNHATYKKLNRILSELRSQV